MLAALLRNGSPIDIERGACMNVRTVIAIGALVVLGAAATGLVLDAAIGTPTASAGPAPAAPMGQTYGANGGYGGAPMPPPWWGATPTWTCYVWINEANVEGSNICSDHGDASSEETETHTHEHKYVKKGDYRDAPKTYPKPAPEPEPCCESGCCGDQDNDIKDSYNQDNDNITRDSNNHHNGNLESFNEDNDNITRDSQNTDSYNDDHSYTCKSYGLIAVTQCQGEAHEEGNSLLSHRNDEPRNGIPYDPVIVRSLV